jgi:hypothetical protein
MKTNIKAFPTLILACFLSLNLCPRLLAQVGDDGVQNFMAQTSSAISARAAKKPKPLNVSLSLPSPTTINEGESATFTVCAKTVNPLQSVTVHYSISGTAVFGTDYILSGTPGQVTIPAGVSSAPITLTALTDNVFPEPNETAIITLGPGAGYKLAKTKKKAPKPTVTIVDVVPAPLGITAVSDSVPLPLTPLTLATTGLAQAGAVSVYFFNDVGFSANAKAIHVETNGTVVIGVPLYMDSASKSIASGTVSMVLRQGNNSSPPASINIQNLPTLETYGTQLGEISHDFLILEAALLGHKLNLLQSAQLLQSSVDTSAAQANTKALLTAAIKSTHDVDGVMSQNSTAISWGNLLDGTPIQFDKDQLDIMDRVIALYLTQQFSGLVSSSSAAGAGTSSVAGHSSISPSDASSVMSEILNMIVSGDGPALVQYVQGNGNGTEAGLATVDALGGSV